MALEYDVTEFLVLLTLLLGGGFVGAALLKKIRFPAVIGFLVLGIIVGPYALGIIQDQGLIELFAELGVIIMLFVVGLEFSFQKLRRAGIRAISVGLSELSVMFFLAYIGAFSLGWSHIESLYLAAILSISSTAISLRVMRDLNLIKTPEFSTVVTILIVEDLAAVLLLVILGNVSSGAGLDFLGVGILILQSLAFFIISLAIGSKLVPFLLDKIQSIDIPESNLLVALSLGFGLAAIAHVLGQSPVIGAFIMGMIISSSKHSEKIIEKVVPLRDFFSVMFFVSIGMLVNLALIPDVLFISIPIIILSVLGKFFGNLFGASMAGHELNGASTIGAAMVPRGEFSFILAKQAVQSGAVRDALYPVTMVVTLVTLICMPLILRAFPTLADSRSMMPMRLIRPIFMIGKLFHKITNPEKQSSLLGKIAKEHGPRFLITLTIIVVILGVIDYFKGEIAGILSATGIFAWIPPDFQITLFSLVLIAVPILMLMRRLGRVVELMADYTSTRLIPAKTTDIELKPLHRLLRNLVFIGFVVLMTAIIQPYTSDAGQVEALPLLAAVIAFVIVFVLSIDSIKVFHEVSSNKILAALLEEKEAAKDPE